MAKYSNTIQYNITTKLDASGFSQLQAQLKNVESTLVSLGGREIISKTQMNKAVTDINALQTALTKAFNVNTGMLNTQKFFASLQTNNTSLAQLSNSFKMAGASGQIAFTNVLGTLGKLDTQLKSSNATLGKFATTIGNTVRWGLIASAFQTIMNSAHRAVEYLGELDKSLTDIQMVGHSSAEDMRNLALEANEAAKAIGSTTVAYTDATKIFVQQGLSLNESQQFAEMSLKLANVAGETAADAAEQITALKNGFQMTGDTVESSLDKIVKTSHITASSVEELATASTRVAATANALGVTDDQLYSQLSTIIQVTREAPEVVGNSLKTIYARFADLKLGETLEDGLDLGAFSGTLEKLGVHVLDSNGQLREMGSIMEDLMDKWDTFDRATKQGAAVTLAGKFQYNRLLTLMENADAYRETVNRLQTDSDVEGLLDTKNAEVYLESLEGKAQRLQATFEGLLSGLFNQDDFGGVLDFFTSLTQGITDITDAIGGGLPVITLLGSTLTKVFSTQIGTGINNIFTNISENMERTKNNVETINQLKTFQQEINSSITSSATNVSTTLENGETKIIKLKSGVESATDSLVNFAIAGKELQSSMTTEQIESWNGAITRTTQNINNLVEAEEELNAITKLLEMGLNSGRAPEERFESDMIADKIENGLLSNTQIEQAKQNLIGLEETYNQVVNSIVVLRDAMNMAPDSSLRGYSTEVIQLEESLIKLSESGVLSEKAMKEVSNVIKVLTKTSDNLAKQKIVEQTLQRWTSEAQKGTTVFGELNDQLNLLEKHKLKGSTKQFDDAKNNVQGAYGAVEADEQANKDKEEGASTQKQSQSLVQVASAVGQLAFAWQSFQSLGSIWANEDLDTGEKILQTLINIGFALPMLISSFESLSNLKIFSQFAPAFKNLGTAFSEVGIAIKNMATGAQKDLLGLLAATEAETTAETAAAAATDVNTASKAKGATAGKALETSNKGIATSATNTAIAERGAAVSTSAFGTAATGAGIAIKGLATSIKTLLLEIWPLLAIGAGIGALTAFLGWIEDTKKATRESAVEAAEASRTQRESIDNTLNSWNKLYSSYKETGEVTDDFISTSKEIAEVLNIEGSEALIAAGNYEKLASSIEAANEKQLQTQISEDRRVIDSYISDFAGTWNNGSVYDDIYQALGSTGNLHIQSLRDNIFGNLDKLDYASIISGVDQITKAIKDEISELQSYGDTASDQQQQRLKDLESTLTALNQQISQEEYQKIAEAYNDQLLAYGRTLNFQEQINSAKDLQSVFDVFASDSKFEAKFNSLTSEADKFAYAIQFASDELKAMMSQEFAFDNFTSNLQESISSYVDENQSKLVFDTAINNRIDANVAADQIKDYLVQSIVEQVNNAELDPEQQMNLLNSLDWSQPIDQILANLQKGLANNGTFNELDLTGGRENLRSYLGNTYQVDENTIESYKEIQEVQTALGDKTEELTSKLEQQREEFGKDSDEANKAKRQLEAYNRTQDELIDLTIQSQKGMDKLADIYEDSFKIIREGNKSLEKGGGTTLEYAEAVSEVKEALADLVNVNPDDLSANFVASESTMQDIEAAVNGDIDAITRLRAAAAEDIVLNLYKQGNLTVEELEYLQQKAWELSGLEIEMYADLDDTDFINTLNGMLSEGSVTAEQIQSYLNAIGYDPVISTESTQYNAFEIPATRIPINILGMDIGGIDIPSITVQGYSEIPKIESIQGLGNPSGGGGGGSHPKPSSSHRPSGGGGGGKGGKGKGGGGGSGSAYEPKEMEAIEDEIDRYERVDTLLEAVSNEYDRVNKNRQRLAGFNAADEMTKEIGLLKDQIALHEEKLKIQKAEAEELRETLRLQYGAAFDEDGFLSNYATIHKRLIDEVNGLIDQYNATTTEEGQEALAEQIDAAKKKLDKFKETYQRYDDLWAGDMQKTINTLEDLKDQIEDIHIEAVKTQVDAVNNLKDLQEKLIEFNAVFSGLSKDNPLRDIATSTAKLAKYFDDGTDSANDFYDTLLKRYKELRAQANTDSLRNWYDLQIQQVIEAQKNLGSGTLDVRGTGYLDMEMSNLQMILEQLRQYNETGRSDFFGENEADLYEVAKDIFNSATDMIMDFEDEIENLHDAIIDAIDDIGDRLDRRREQYENINDELEHQLEIWKLLHGDQDYDNLNQLLGAQQANYRQSIQELTQQKALLEELLSGLEEGSEEWQNVLEMITDTQKELNDLVEESLDNLRKQYENTVSSIGDNWIQGALGTDLDWMEEQWEMINRNADYYLDDVNASYEIQKLQNKYLKLLDDASGMSAEKQRQITEQMQQQLAYLREKEKISEYDVAYAEAQLELLQRRIALEEAQANKSQLKLRRDSQGNYNYVYTAKEGDTRDLEMDYLEAQNNAYNLSKEQMRQTQEDSLSALQDARRLIDDIWNDANLSLEEKKARTQTVIDSLKEYLAGTSEQLSESQKNIINDFIGMVDILTDENDQRLQEVYEQIVQGNNDAFDEIDTRWSDSLTEWLQNMDDFNDATDQMFQELIDNAVDYQEQTDIIADLVEQDFNRVSDAVQRATGAMNDLAASNAAFMTQLQESSGAIRKAEADMNSYADMIRDAENAMRDYQDQVNDLQGQLVSKERENSNLADQIRDLESKYNSEYLNAGNNGAGGNGSGNGSPNVWVGSWVGYNGKYYHDSWGSSPAGSLFAGQPGAVQIDSWSSTAYGGKAKTTGDFAVHINNPKAGYNDLGWVKVSQLFDTGGYTGSWTDGVEDAKNGKLAWLHSKELVLNETDTQYILQAVDAVRTMVQAIKGGALTGITEAFMNSNSFSPIEQKISQDTFEIHAEFPNANSVDEIRDAIISLPDYANQINSRYR